MKIKKRTVISIGVIFVFIGIFLLLSNYFEMKKIKVYDTITLAISEIPTNIDNEDEIIDNILSDDVIDNPNNEDNNDIEDNNNDNNSSNSNKYTTPDIYYIGKLEIPSINLSKGFTSMDSKYNNVNYNITIIKGSDYPDVNNGNFILAGHTGSSSIGFFNKLHNIKSNAYAYIYYNNVKYKYKLVTMYEEEKTGTVTISRDKNKNVLTLITCTKGTKTKQSIFIFNLVDKENY